MVLYANPAELDYFQYPLEGCKFLYAIIFYKNTTENNFEGTKFLIGMSIPT